MNMHNNGQQQHIIEDRDDIMEHIRMNEHHYDQNGFQIHPHDSQRDGSTSDQDGSTTDFRSSRNRGNTFTSQGTNTTNQHYINNDINHVIRLNIQNDSERMDYNHLEVNQMKQQKTQDTLTIDSIDQQQRDVYEDGSHGDGDRSEIIPPQSRHENTEVTESGLFHNPQNQRVESTVSRTQFTNTLNSFNEATTSKDIHGMNHNNNQNEEDYLVVKGMGITPSLVPLSDNSRKDLLYKENGNSNNDDYNRVNEALIEAENSTGDEYMTANSDAFSPSQDGSRRVMDDDTESDGSNIIGNIVDEMSGDGTQRKRKKKSKGRLRMKGFSKLKGDNKYNKMQSKIKLHQERNNYMKISQHATNISLVELPEIHDNNVSLAAIDDQPLPPEPMENNDGNMGFGGLPPPQQEQPELAMSDVPTLPPEPTASDAYSAAISATDANDELHEDMYQNIEPGKGGDIATKPTLKGNSSGNTRFSNDTTITTINSEEQDYGNNKFELK